MNHSYEITLDFKHTRPKTPRKKPTFTQRRTPKLKRSKRGCLNCRKSRKKCSESRPCCVRCASKGIECVWPVLKKEDQIIQTENGILAMQLSALESSMRSLIPLNNPNSMHQENISDIPKLLLVEPHNFPQPSHYHHGQINVQSEAIASTHHFDTLKRELMNACLYGFLGSVSTQYSTSNNTNKNKDKDSAATITQMFHEDPKHSRNTMLEQVAYACGAAFMLGDKDNHTAGSSADQSMAMKLYETAFQDLCLFIDRVDSLDRDELIWICCASQMLCLCGKTLDKGREFVLLNLKNSYEVVQARIQQWRKDKYERGEDQSCVMDLISMNEDEPSQKQSLLLATTSDQREKMTTSLNYLTSERMIVESFVYHYSVSLITFVNLDECGLPNPFDIFKDIRSFLGVPLFKYEVVLMDSLLLGAAWDAFELIGKTSYLFRHINNPESIVMAERLLNVVSYYPAAIIPLDVDQNKYNSLKESVIVSDTALKCCKMLLIKITNFDTIDENSQEIQQEVKHIIEKLRTLSHGCLVKRISTWVLFITGLLCIESDHRDLIIMELTEVCKDTHSKHIMNVIEVLRDSWSGETGTLTGFDVLWDGQIMESLAL